MDNGTPYEKNCIIWPSFRFRMVNFFICHDDIFIIWSHLFLDHLKGFQDQKLSSFSPFIFMTRNRPNMTENDWTFIHKCIMWTLYLFISQRVCFELVKIENWDQLQANFIIFSIVKYDFLANDNFCSIIVLESQANMLLLFLS